MPADWPLKRKYRVKKGVKSTPYTGSNSGTKKSRAVDWSKETGRGNGRGGT